VANFLIDRVSPVLEGEGHEASEEENSGEEEHVSEEAAGGRSAGGKKRRKKIKNGEASGRKVFARGGFSDAAGDWQADLDNQQRERLEEKEKKKAEDIWAGRDLKAYVYACFFFFLQTTGVPVLVQKQFFPFNGPKLGFAHRKIFAPNATL
jgi:hypothetical protein